MKIGFIGAGNMGSALAQAVAKCSDCEILVADPDKAKCKALNEEISASVSSAAEIAEVCEFIFLAVKPNLVKNVLDEIRPSLERSCGFTLISMAAGLSLAHLEKLCGIKCPIIRIMPNTAVAVGCGIVLCSANTTTDRITVERFKLLLAGAGAVDEIEEALIDAGTALSGCSPAFVYMFIEALTDGAVKSGLPRDTAQEYAAKTLIGAATLLLESGKCASELRDAVCSPGGSTIEGVKTLEEGGLNETVSNAVIASYNKTLKLGK